MKVGDKRRLYGKTLVHIRGFIDDQVIYRFWNRRRGWVYMGMDIQSAQEYLKPDKFVKSHLTTRKK